MSSDEFVFLMWSMNEKPVRTAINHNNNNNNDNNDNNDNNNNLETINNAPPSNTVKQNISHEMHKDDYIPNPKTVDREKISDTMAQRMPMAQFTMNPFIQSDYLQDLENQERFLKPLNSSYSKDVQKELASETN